MSVPKGVVKRCRSPFHPPVRRLHPRAGMLAGLGEQDAARG